MRAVRILFTFAGGSGHAEPLVPIARAAAAAGHDVAFAGQSAVVGGLRERGFQVFPEPVDTTGTRPTPGPLLAPNMAHEERVLREAYAGRIARARADSVLDACARWSPDVVVCDEADFGGAIAAERYGVPLATVLVTAAGGFVRADVVAEPLDALRAEHGLPPDPAFEAPWRGLVLSPFPPSFRDPAFPLPPGTCSLGPPSVVDAGDPVPTWLTGPPSARPAVYVTLGTIFNMESGDLLARMVAGVRELPVEVIATVGPAFDPQALGPQPRNVRVERFVPQAAVLPRCAAVVNHGGSGSVLGALAAGLPSVVIPLGADQPLNAARCEALGVGVALDAVRATPADVRDAVRSVLDEPRYAAAARRLRDECAALPGPEHAVPLLERLAGAKR